MIISLPLLIISATLGIFLLIKAQKESLSQGYKAAAWFIIVLSCLLFVCSIIFGSIKMCHKRMRGGCAGGACSKNIEMMHHDMGGGDHFGKRKMIIKKYGDGHCGDNESDDIIELENGMNTKEIEVIKESINGKDTVIVKTK